jgi:hypothetical protein
MNLDKQIQTKRPAYNVRFGATAAGSGNLKGSAKMPPLRQAAASLYASRRERCRKSNSTRKSSTARQSSGI